MAVKKPTPSDDDLVLFLSQQYGVPRVNLGEFDIPDEVLRLVPTELALKHRLVPINDAGETLVVAMADPSSVFAIDDVKRRTGRKVEVVVANERQIVALIERQSGRVGRRLPGGG
jgi:type IV pilus assembly protein PilB